MEKTYDFDTAGMMALIAAIVKNLADEYRLAYAAWRKSGVNYEKVQSLRKEAERAWYETPNVSVIGVLESVEREVDASLA